MHVNNLKLAQKRIAQQRGSKRVNVNAAKVSGLASGYVAGRQWKR